MVIVVVIIIVVVISCLLFGNDVVLFTVVHWDECMEGVIELVPIHGDRVSR